MGGPRERMLRSTRLLSLSTLVSRVLGFFREVLTAAVLGGSSLMSGWVLAITLPNLFRRILGEGALGTALIPMMVHSIEQEGEGVARKRFTTIFIWLSILLSAITAAVAIAAWIAADFVGTERWRIAVRLMPLVMPYSIFICGVGVLTSYANSLREYVLPSLAAILQNVLLVGALYLIGRGVFPGRDPLHFLGMTVLFAGLLELLLLLWIVHRKKMSLHFSKGVLTDGDTLLSIGRLALPGIVGASALQISLVCDRVIAGFLSDYAVPALYNSERLVYLPIGIFAFAFGTVSLSEMARASAKNDQNGMLSMMMFSLKNLLFITIPIAVFMFLFSEELIRAVFVRGAFGERELSETVSAMAYYVLGIPSFAAYKVTVSGFTARKDMVTPLKVTLCCVALNIVLSLSLMIPLKQGGIALATVLSSLVNNLLLMTLLTRKFGAEPFGYGAFFRSLARFAEISLIAGIPAFLAGRYWFRFVPLHRLTPDGTASGRLLSPDSFLTSCLSLLIAGGVFALVFLLAGHLTRLPEQRALLSRIFPPRGATKGTCEP